MHKFRPGVAEKLGFYVYRLVDPRNGETFYVGKGRGDRVFDHVNEVPGLADESEKQRRITDIRRDGEEPLHVIHRHGMGSEDAAYLVEAALMDAYAGLTNATRGEGTSEFGPASVASLEARYSPREGPDPTRSRQSRNHSGEEIVFCGPTVTVKITDRMLRARGDSVYETVRGNWIIGPERLAMLRATPHHVLAILKRKCVGVYCVEAGVWRVNPEVGGDKPRCHFEGKRADEETCAKYEGKRYADRSQWPVQLHGFR